MPQGDWSLMTGSLGAMVRRLAPSGGDFAQAGWHGFEVSAQE